MKPLPIRTSKHPLAIFFFLTFLLSWALWLASGIFNKPTPTETRDYSWLIAQFGVFMPSVMALLISSFTDPRQRGISWTILLLIFLPVSLLGVWIASVAPNKILQLDTAPAILVGVAALGIIVFFSPLNRHQAALGLKPQEAQKRIGWILFSIIFLPISFLMAWLLVNASGGDFAVTVLGGDLLKSLRSVALIFAFNLFLGGTLGEEIGWRGFALPRLLEKFSPLQASFILGIVWALWHLPIDIRYGFGLTGIGAVIVRLLWTWPITIIFTWFYLRSKRCLLVPFMLHTSVNIIPDLGFSNYEQAIGVMFLVNAVVATAIGFSLAKNPEGKVFKPRMV
jgi:membrane protease YdiL (CAAX protease family)